MALSVSPALNPMENLRARLADHRIELRGEVGRGATATVYQGYDLRHGRLLAVKVLRPELSAVLGTDRFLREIHIAAALQHPHIVPIYDSGTVDGTPFYVMPYIDGESLRQRLARTGRLPIGTALRIAGQVGDALGYAHARGVVHRDIKPENIVLQGDDAMVVDFGIAMSTGSEGAAVGESMREDGGRLTGEGVVIGTPAYMSPEQASPDTVVDSRSDIFSLGCVVYEMLAGEPPFRGGSAQSVIAKRFQIHPTELSVCRPEIPAWISEAVDKALAVDPAARFARVEDFVAALSNGSPVSPHRPRFSVRLRVALSGGLALIALLLLANRLAGRHLPGLDPRRVAVAALSNETGEDSLAPLGRLVTDWITDRLNRTGKVEVVTSATVVPAQHDARVTGQPWDGPEQLHHLALETRAGTLVSGSYYRGSKRAVEFHIEVTDANSGQLLDAIGPVESRGDSKAIADQLSRAVTEAVDSLAAAKRR
jgi:eukaryotic-like serine/threonine-protein kinase